MQRARHPHMPDDSVSDFTDLDKEEVLAKYHEDKMSIIDKRKRDRAEARRRLRGDNKGSYEPRLDEVHHICKKQPKSRCGCISRCGKSDLGSQRA